MTEYALRTIDSWTWCGSDLHNRALPWGAPATHDDAILPPETLHFHRAEPFSILCMDCHAILVERPDTPPTTTTVLPDGEYVRTIGPGSIIPSERVTAY